jgi:pSer/pThr/pTyr-binding forkhead associated (FHA) protein
MSDRASPPARAVVTPAAAQPFASTLHESSASAAASRPSAPMSRRDADATPEPARRDPPPSGEYGQPADVRVSSLVSARGPESTRHCPNCKAPAQSQLPFCRECGTAITPSMEVAQAEPQPASANCWRCHAGRDPGAAFCRFCGASFGDSSTGPRLTPLQNAAAPHLPTAAATSARLVTLLKDGSEGRSIPLGEGDADVGSSEGSVTFPDDPYMSPRHARVAFRGGSYTLRDLDSVNGVYVRLRDEVELRDRDTVLIGQQVLRFELMGDGELSLGPAWQRGVLVFGTPEAARFARLVQYTTEGVARDVHYLFRDETAIGRENGDIVFTDDPFLSRRHAAVRVDHARRRYTLHDLGSSNGTALRIRGEHVLRDGDQFRIGRHLFRYEAGPVGGRAGR